MTTMFLCDGCKKYVDSAEKNEMSLVNDDGIPTGKTVWLCKLCALKLHKREMATLATRIKPYAMQAILAEGKDLAGIIKQATEHIENLADI